MKFAPARSEPKDFSRGVCGNVRLSRSKPLNFEQGQVIAQVARIAKLPYMIVQDIIDDLFELTANELKQKGTSKFANIVCLKFEVKGATPAKAGIHPFTKEPCVFKAKPASKTVRAVATKKLKDVLKDDLAHP